MNLAQQWAASGSQGWGGRLCNVMTRHDPREEMNNDEKMEHREIVVPEVKNFVTPNSFENLAESEEEKDPERTGSDAHSDVLIRAACECPPVPTPQISPQWRRPERRPTRDCIMKYSTCDCQEFECSDQFANDNSQYNSKLSVVGPEVISEESPSDESNEESVRKRNGKKKNRSARNKGRRMRLAAEDELVEAETSEQVEQIGSVWRFDFRDLMQIIAEKAMMPEAILNYSTFKCLDIDMITPEMIRESSAGVYGWASAVVEEWHDSSIRDLMRSGMGLPPAADDDRHGEQSRIKNNQDPPESKPLLPSTQKGIEDRERWLQHQEREKEAGRKLIGVYDAKDVRSELREQWQTVCRDRKEAAIEKRRAELHVCMRNQDQQPLLTAWRTEAEGWHQIEVVLDSGAADSVCPRNMCPQFPIEDSEASKAGVYYTGANGGKLFNLGQTHVPVSLDNGSRSLATFQVADVSRPLMSVSKVCEMGNRVVFGAAGGYILNIATGATTQFIKKDGIYVFNMWIPPLSESPFGRPR